MSEIGLNLAAFHLGTQVLGPGKRAAIWVQGCPFHCRGCIAPAWIPFTPAHPINPWRLAEIIFNHPGIQGLTISGGEPMLQAEGLLVLIQALKENRDYDVICFTGFKLEVLRTSPPNSYIADFLQELDVLIDGPYIENLNDGLGLRGSANQRVHHFTDRLCDFDFVNTPRRVELIVQDGEALLVGIPSKPFLTAYDQAFDRLRQKLARGHELTVGRADDQSERRADGPSYLRGVDR